MSPREVMRRRYRDRWLKVFALLSINKTSRFLVDMGLQGWSTDCVCRAAEDAYRGLIEQAQPDDETESSIVEEKRIVESFLNRVSEQCASTLSSDLVNWADKMFPPDTLLSTQAFLWSQIIKRWACDGARVSGMPVKVKEAANTIAVAISEVCALGRVLDRVTAAEGEPTTAWEEFVLSHYPPECSPLDDVVACVNLVAVVGLWRAIEEELTTDEQELFVNWVRAKAVELGVPEDRLQFPLSASGRR